MRGSKNRLVAGIYTFTGVLVALAFSWMALAALNFSYGIWHDYGGIGSAIDRYGGSNKFRSGFELTSKAQREELFAGIVQAIHFQPQQLRRLEYQVAGHPAQTLLTEPEVVHLQDVARLVTIGAFAASAALLVWGGCIIYYLMRRQRPPRLKNQFLGTLLVLAAVGAVVFMVGPVEVFYLLHTWVFPEGHAWFFYYQESLMSTMMYAPVLFGWIALEWLVLTLLVFVALQYIVAQLCEWRLRQKQSRTM